MSTSLWGCETNINHNAGNRTGNIPINGCTPQYCRWHFFVGVMKLGAQTINNAKYDFEPTDPQPSEWPLRRSNYLYLVHSLFGLVNISMSMLYSEEQPVQPLSMNESINERCICHHSIQKHILATMVQAYTMLIVTDSDQHQHHQQTYPATYHGSCPLKCYPITPPPGIPGADDLTDLTMPAKRLPRSMANSWHLPQFTACVWWLWVLVD